MKGSDSTTGTVISSDKVEGTSVYSDAGEKLGSIDDLMIDKVSGQVRYAILEFGGFLGVGADRFPVPWSMLKFDTDTGGYRVPLNKERIQMAPKYDAGKVPTFDALYGAGVNKFYGM